MVGFEYYSGNDMNTMILYRDIEDSDHTNRIIIKSKNAELMQSLYYYIKVFKNEIGKIKYQEFIRASNKLEKVNKKRYFGIFSSLDNLNHDYTEKELDDNILVELFYYFFEFPLIREFIEKDIDEARNLIMLMKDYISKEEILGKLNEKLKMIAYIQLNKKWIFDIEGIIAEKRYMRDYDYDKDVIYYLFCNGFLRIHDIPIDIDFHIDTDVYNLNEKLKELKDSITEVKK